MSEPKKLTIETSRIQPSPKGCERYVVTLVAFERELNPDEVEVLRDNFKQGKINTNPDEDLSSAVEQQLALELQLSYDELGALTGNFQVLKSMQGHIIK